MFRSIVFRSKGLQAVRLPKAAAFPANVGNVVVLCQGQSRVIAPTNALWDDFFEAPGIDIDRGEQL